MLTVRQSLSAATAAAFLCTGACQSRERQANETGNAANAAEPQTVPKLPLPVPQPPMNREQLLLASMRAASAFAAGTDDTQLQKSLANKNYELRIRFGCEGPGKAGTKEPLAWTYDSKTRALKIRATPQLSSKDAPVRAVAGDAFETVEGFWLRRPWLLDPVCPSTSAGSAANAGSPQPPPELVGIAQFFTSTGPRTFRRSGRAYESTKKLDSDLPPTGGFDLVLKGRLVPLPDGRIIACTRSEAGGRPACLISVEFGKVSIERADTHEQLAQWGSG
jgi:hypothetical protein